MRALISDDVAAVYEVDAERNQLLLDHVLDRQLDRFKDVSITAPVIIITGEVRDRLQTILGSGSILSPEDLLKKVQRLAELRIGNILVDLTPTQWEEIITRAKRNERLLADELHEVVQQIVQGFHAVV